MLRLSARKVATRPPMRMAARQLATASEGSSSSSLVLTDPLKVYRGLVATGAVQQDSEQIRALMQ